MGILSWWEKSIWCILKLMRKKLLQLSKEFLPVEAIKLPAKSIWNSSFDLDRSVNNGSEEKIESVVFVRFNHTLRMICRSGRHRWYLCASLVTIISGVIKIGSYPACVMWSSNMTVPSSKLLVVISFDRSIIFVDLLDWD